MKPTSIFYARFIAVTTIAFCGVQWLQKTKQSALLAQAPTPSVQPANQSLVKIPERDFIIYSSSEANDSPRLAVRVAFLDYKNRPSLRTFEPSQAPQTPEEVFALQEKYLRSPNASVAAFKSLYLNRKPQQTDKEIKSLLVAGNQLSKRIRDIKLRNRYDVGSLSFLTGNLIYLPKATPFLRSTYSTTRRANKRAYAADFSIFDDYPAIGAVRMAEEDTIRNQAPSDLKLPYSVSLPSPQPGDPATLRPVRLFFDGRQVDLPLEHTAHDGNDPIMRFTHRVFQTYRIGTQKQWFDLWSDTDAAAWKNAFAHDRDQFQYKEERRRFSGDQWRVFFIMDLGKNVIVFLHDAEVPSPEPTIDRLVFLKRGDSYVLTRGERLPSGKETFNSELDLLLYSKPFEEFLRPLVAEVEPA